MSLIDKILNKEEKKKEIKLQQGVNTVQTVIEESNSQKEASEKAVNVAIEEIQAHPEMPVGEFMKRLQKNTDLTDADLVRIIKQLPDVKSEEATVAAVKATDLSSPKIAEIIEDAPISPNVAQKIAEQIPDEDIQKKQQEKIDKELAEQKRQKIIEEENQIVKHLSQIYETCDNIEDPELVQQIQSLYIDRNILTDKIKNKVLDILAKRTAIDCMKYGGPKIPTLAFALSPNDDLTLEMFEANLPILTQKEYKKLKVAYDEQDKHYHEYGESEKKLVQEKLLEGIAKKSAKTFDEIGDFNIPTSKQFLTLSDEDLQHFANTVKIYSKSGLDDIDESRLVRQLNGENTAELQELNKMIEKMNPRDKDIAIQNIFNLLKANSKENKSSTQKAIDESIEDITSKIRRLPQEKQLITAKAINTVLDQQQESIKLFKNIKKADSQEEQGTDR